ncbi:MAG TPA: hypothetical protein PK566_03880 [Pseudobacteroides sp.]|nr:hypothetical protein [Pseudobacteroides sp.]
MKNHQKSDKVYVNAIKQPNHVDTTSDKPAGIASDEPSCIYNHMRHAEGSKITNDDGSEMVCNKEGSWVHTKKK